MQAVSIQKQFCPNWSLLNPGSGCGGGASELTLRCGTRVSTLYGGGWLPYPPTFQPGGVIFPKRRRGYKGVQMIQPTGSGKGNMNLGVPDCRQDFSVGIDCLYDGSPCIVMAAWDPACDGPVELCGAGGYY